MIIRHNSAIVLLLLLVALFSLASTRATDESRRTIHVPQIVARGRDEKRDGSVLKSGSKKLSYISHSSTDLVCRPFGECEPCPSDELDQPFCLPFGNRRLLHCVLSQDSNTNSPPSNGGGGQSGEVPAWEACGKVIKKERQDFWEFVTANILLLVIALTILWARTSALATEQYRQLAARIGIPGSTWRT